MNVGFVGLGIMGAPMAGHLLHGGHRVQTVLRRSVAPGALIESGLEVLNDLHSLALNNDVLVTMLPDTPIVEGVLFGDGGLLTGIRPNTLVIDMSSISPEATKRFAKVLADRNCEFVDAPVSGGELGAKAASLTIMVGGKAPAFARALPLLQCMGKSITHVGDFAGAGQICKIANQIMVALNIEAAAEALVFASKAGCDPVLVRQALMGGFASSRALDAHGERMINRTFGPGFRIRLHQKDLCNALDAARNVGVCLPNTASVLQLFNSCIANGDGDQDHSALVCALERLSNYAIQKN